MTPNSVPRDMTCVIRGDPGIYGWQYGGDGDLPRYHAASSVPIVVLKLYEGEALWPKAQTKVWHVAGPIALFASLGRRDGMR